MSILPYGQHPNNPQTRSMVGVTEKTEKKVTIENIDKCHGCGSVQGMPSTNTLSGIWKIINSTISTVLNVPPVLKTVQQTYCLKD